MTKRDWEVRRLTVDDGAQLAEFGRRHRWPHGGADWRRLLDWEPEGCFGVEDAGRIIGTATTTTYGASLGWIGMVLVDEDHRRQGVGSALTEACLAYLRARRAARVMLDASETGLTLYRRFGFRELYRVHTWRGQASEFWGPRAKRLRAADMSAVIEFDERRFGAPRGRVLLRLQAEFPRLGWVDRDAHGRVRGYLLARRVGEEVWLGPWLHDSPWGATTLLCAALGAVRGQTVTAGLPDRNLSAAPIVQDHALHMTGHTTRMILGDADPLPDEPTAIFAVASLATG
jgi:ribosomal protein S18 acetylase RimI-like enzyme